MVEMKVYGLALAEDSQTPVLILKDDASNRVLPIWIGAMEAMAISLALNEVKLPRPLTHDLLNHVLANLDVTLARVEVTALRDGAYFAELELAREGQPPLRVDSRPSDAVALALRANAPIFVDESILEQSAESAEALLGKAGLAGLTDAGDERWTEMLENFSDDAKYKM